MSEEHLVHPIKISGFCPQTVIKPRLDQIRKKMEAYKQNAERAHLNLRPSSSEGGIHITSSQISEQLNLITIYCRFVSTYREHTYLDRILFCSEDEDEVLGERVFSHEGTLICYEDGREFFLLEDYKVIDEKMTEYENWKHNLI